jgi:hypothetical protein
MHPERSLPCYPPAKQRGYPNKGPRKISRNGAAIGKRRGPPSARMPYDATQFLRPRISAMTAARTAASGESTGPSPSTATNRRFSPVVGCDQA